MERASYEQRDDVRVAYTLLYMYTHYTIQYMDVLSKYVVPYALPSSNSSQPKKHQQNHRWASSTEYAAFSSKYNIPLMHPRPLAIVYKQTLGSHIRNTFARSLGLLGASLYSLWKAMFHGLATSLWPYQVKHTHTHTHGRTHAHTQPQPRTFHWFGFVLSQRGLQNNKSIKKEEEEKERCKARSWHSPKRL